MKRNSRLMSFADYAHRKGTVAALSQFLGMTLLKYGLKGYMQGNGNPIYLRPGSSDLPTYRQVYVDGEYDLHVPFRPRLVVDLGANIGLFSTYYASKFPDARIIALEPFPSNYEAMLANIKPYPNIKAVNAAIWKEDTFRPLLFTPAMGEWGVTVDDSTGSTEGNNLTKCISMDTLMADHNMDMIDILKIDIEGSERELFESPGAWLYKVRMIIVELHDFITPGMSNNFIRAIATIPHFTIDSSGENIVVINTDLK